MEIAFKRDFRPFLIGFVFQSLVTKLWMSRFSELINLFPYDLIGKTGMDFFRNKKAEILNQLDSENVDYSIQRHRFLDFTLSFQYCS